MGLAWELPGLPGLHLLHLLHLLNSMSVPPPGTLELILHGLPLSQRSDEQLKKLGASLDAFLGEALEILEGLQIEPVAWADVKKELEEIVKMSCSEEGLQCKRSLLLYAISAEPALQARFEQSDPELLADLKTRVFPLIVPVLLRNVGQRPDAFAASIVILTKLWPLTDFKFRRPAKGPEGGGGAC